MVLVLLVSGSGISFRDYLKTSDMRISLTGIGLGISGGVLLYLLWPLLGVPVNINIFLGNIGLNEFTWKFFLAYHILVNPWIEEYYWRMYLGSSSQRIILNDLFFAGYHLLVLAGKMNILWLAACFIVLAGAAWFWRQTTRISSGLFSSTTSHLAADLTVMLTIYFMTKAG
jgi:hypothetical protein